MKSFILAGLVVIVMAACAPPFLEDLNRASGMTGHMAAAGTVGSVSFGNDTNVRFYPTKPTATSIDGVDIQSGFVVSTGSGGTNDYLRFAWNSDGKAQTSDSQPYFATGANPYPVTEYDVTNTTSTANIVVLDWSNIANPTYTFYAVNPSGSTTLTPTAANHAPLNFVFSSATAYGVQMMPQPGAADTFNFFLFNAGIPQNGPATVSITTGFTPGTQTTLAPTTPMRLLYYMNQAQATAYTSYFISGAWSCNQITSTSVMPLSGVSNRIDAVLTSGQLLSTQDGTLRLYDASGNQLFSKPLNGLQYCYEAYMGSTPYLFFSLPLSLQHGEWVFNVYAIATSSIGDLGK
jgi:hypothetical protein